MAFHLKHMNSKKTTIKKHELTIYLGELKFEKEFPNYQY